MQNHSKSNCMSTSHQLLVDNANNRLNDLQERFTDLQAARKEGRTSDVAVLEEQVYQSLREWKAELSGPSPASSLIGGSIGSFSDDIARLLQLCEEEDDAISALAEPAVLKPEPVVQSLRPSILPAAQEDYIVNSEPQEHEYQCKGPASAMHNTVDAGSNILQNICPPPSAFLGPKCALWDCARPAQGSEWYEDYCSSFHATLALNEDPPGTTPILRPGGIGLKDNLLLDALRAKTQGKNVGIPKCKGAASTKCPWNATELFDLSLLEGETIREWLFFDKPRRAFESGNRKQRSLPDYSGRGWHESRKQVMKEFGGQKRSYYMDPQPPGCFEWHLYEYEINSCDACALYRLELKLFNGKKNPKGKVTKDPLADLQKKMGRLTAEVSSDNSRSSVKGKTKANKGATSENVSSALH